jgi:L,D-peptidoglycan transpeptidase YkuD (ErfK/YbiS/YcfS/YnhG family)
LRLEKDKHICVDDPDSLHYSQIVSRAEAGAGTHGEELASQVVYEKGIAVDYPTSGEARGGSCIFLHVWRGTGEGTTGVAASLATIARLQDFAAGRRAAIAIVPMTAHDRLAACLPK